jgi:hypothetical protein
MKGKKFVALFFLVVALLSLSSVLVLKDLRPQDNVQSKQRNLARALPNLYLKYQIDNKQWPETPKEAAINFRGENPEFVKRIEDAEKEWGMKVNISERDVPWLVVRFEKPLPFTMDFILERK